MRSKSAAKSGPSSSQTAKDNGWIEQEAQGCQFQDVRLAKQFATLREMIFRRGAKRFQQLLGLGNTKAAYRFLSNERLTEDEILARHFQATAVRMALDQGPFLILHDTTEFSYEQANPDALGLLNRPAVGRIADGRLKHKIMRCILMHSSLAVSLEGLPLGLAAIKFGHARSSKVAMP